MLHFFVIADDVSLSINADTCDASPFTSNSVSLFAVVGISSLSIGNNIFLFAIVGDAF